MATIVVFDELSTPQQMLALYTRRDPAPFRGRTDAVIEPDLSLLAMFDVTRRVESYLVPRKYWKHVGGAIVEYTQAEKDAQDAAEAAAEAAEVAQAILDDKAGGKARKGGRREQDVFNRAMSQVIRAEFNRIHRNFRQTMNALDSSSGGAQNTRDAVSAERATNDETNLTKLEWNTQIDAAIDAMNLDDPGSDPDE